jgi:hypothetical protein
MCRIPCAVLPEKRMAEGAKPVLREMTLEDWSVVNHLEHRCGLGGHRDRVSWEHLVTANPASRIFTVAPSMGWVLETQGRIVGALSNIPLQYVHGTTTIRVAVARGWAVDPDYRGHGVQLLKAFSKQKEVDVLLSTTANPHSVSPLYCKLFKFELMPQKDFFNQLVWVVHSRPFAAELMERSRLPAPARGVLKRLLPVLFAGHRTLRSGKLRLLAQDLPITTISPQEIGPDFDALWARKLEEPRKWFMQIRDAENLRWRFGRPGSPRPAQVLCCRRAGRLCGYAVLELTQTQGGRWKATITDLLAENEDDAVISQLLRGCLQQARKDGAFMLDIWGFPASIRKALLSAKPYVRELSQSYQGTYLFKTTCPLLTASLRLEEAWYACNSDGDTDL